MDIKLTEEQNALQGAASRFMQDHCTFDFVRQIENDSELGYCPTMWAQFAEMGWLGMLVPEEFGGMAMTLLDTVVLAREMGRHICPSPFLATSVLAAEVINSACNNAQKTALLPQFVSGQ